MATTGPRTGYAPVNGLNLYYEIHGTGRPLVLLHGAFMTIEQFGELVPGLARTRQVISVELQAHGRTADVDRPLRYEMLADDVAALLRHLGIDQADVYGYSLGGGAALQLALRHPELVRKLVLVSMSISSAGLHPEVMATIATITPELFYGTPWHDAYVRVAPRPDDFPNLVAKMKALDAEEYSWPADKFAALTAPTLIVVGDSDGTRPEHAVEMFRLRGGGVFGDFAGLPTSQLAILPGTTHVGVLESADLLLAMIPRFLDAPMPGAG
jgi:pimeloyl-ACP methyl ester carboxylesterase